MRYLIQLLVPALIFAGVVYLLTRRRRQHVSRDTGDTGDAAGSETGPFIVILIVSATVALGTAWMLQSMWEA